MRNLLGKKKKKMNKLSSSLSGFSCRVSENQIKIKNFTVLPTYYFEVLGFAQKYMR